MDPDEELGILFKLQTGYYLGDVEADLASRALRIGIHAISIGEDEGGESFVNNNNPVPIPASVLLLGSGLIGLVGLVGFRRKK